MKSKKIKKVGAPIGNQNAKGYGRPPNEGYSNADLIDLGEELIAWLDLQDEIKNYDVFHLSEWYSRVKHISRSQWRSICSRDCFIPYYDRARVRMGVNILKSKTLPPAYGHRFLPIYFSDLAEHEKEKRQETIDYEIARKKELEKSRGQYPNDAKLDELLASIKKERVDDLRARD